MRCPSRHGGRQRGERIVHQHDVGDAARGLAAALHRHAQVGLLERQHVVDAIADHGDVVPAPAQRLHQPLFLLRRDAPEDRAARCRLGELRVVHLRQLQAGDEPDVRAEPRLSRQRRDGFRVVAGDDLWPARPP